MDRRAMISFNVTVWLVRLFFLVLVLTALFLITGIYATPDIPEWRVESEILVNRLLYSPNGFSYFDPVSNRVYPGMISLANVKTHELEQNLGAKIIIKQDNKILKEAFINKKIHQRIAEEGKVGKGGVDVLRKNYYLLVKDKGMASVSFEVVVPRS